MDIDPTILETLQLPALLILMLKAFIWDWKRVRKYQSQDKSKEAVLKDIHTVLIAIKESQIVGATLLGRIFEEQKEQRQRLDMMAMHRKDE